MSPRVGYTVRSRQHVVRITHSVRAYCGWVRAGCGWVKLARFTFSIDSIDSSILVRSQQQYVRSIQQYLVCCISTSPYYNSCRGARRHTRISYRRPGREIYCVVLGGAGTYHHRDLRFLAH